MAKSLRQPSEDKEQKAVLGWLRNRGHFVYHVPNGIPCNAITMNRFKSIGLTPGIPDLQVVLNRGQVVWVEMKRRKNGRLDPKQKEIHSQLSALGHTIVLALGAKDAVTQLRELGL